MEEEKFLPSFARFKKQGRPGEEMATPRFGGHQPRGTRSTNQALINFDLKAEELEAYLDEYMIGQSEAKAVLATKMCTHFHRVRYMLEKGGRFQD
jgi:hypothetical protein